MPPSNHPRRLVSYFFIITSSSQAWELLSCEGRQRAYQFHVLLFTITLLSRC